MPFLFICGHYSAETAPIQQQYLGPFLNTLPSLIPHPVPHRRDIAVQCLEAILPRPECRTAVWGSASIIPGYVSWFNPTVSQAKSCIWSRFVDILKHNPGPQMCYQIGFCFWLLTFDTTISEEINKSVRPCLSSAMNSDTRDAGNTILYHFSRTLRKQPSKRKSSV